ncbi:phosphatase PAP2 family protein [Paenibacillus cymbidii]|uniref:phosphatase PAP2 family protein n=1 Tax=Paenibacillus cymbidii TaxID=1639034 RepID=UPI0010813211|nr:phosphatase PAP2 family protein [Paenibacillus cymbidii]
MTFFYQSMNHVVLAIVITTFFLLLFSIRTNPFFAAGAFVQEMFTSRKYLLHFTAMIAILFSNKMELWLEQHMHSRADFTDQIYALEGNFVASIQTWFRNDALTQASTFFYVVVFTSVMIASTLFYTYTKQYKLFYAVCYALIFNYLIAIPFYLFFPVREVWSFHPNVSMLIHDLFPTFEQDYRPLSGIDNCFPSLHTSISVTMAVIAMRSNNRFWRVFTACSAVFIIFSIFYLGIHWLTDMCAGMLLGLFAARTALRIAEGKPLLVTNLLSGLLRSRQIGK